MGSIKTGYENRQSLRYPAHLVKPVPREFGCALGAGAGRLWISILDLPEPPAATNCQCILCQTIAPSGNIGAGAEAHLATICRAFLQNSNWPSVGLSEHGAAPAHETRTTETSNPQNSNPHET